MDDSFHLLSTMSPKVGKKGKDRICSRIPTKLALKKHVRRSAMLDNLPSTTERCSLALVESSTTDSTETSSFHSAKADNENVTVITISDSDSSGSKNHNNKETYRSKLPEDIESKFRDINEWVSKVNLEIDNFALKECTSSLDVAKNVKMNAVGDELDNCEEDDLTKSFNYLHIKDSITVGNSCSYFKSQLIKYGNNEDSNNVTTPNRNKNFDDDILNDIVENSDDDNACSQNSLFDNFHSNKKAFPRTEPRKRTQKSVTKKTASKTERKSKEKHSGACKNSYLDCEVSSDKTKASKPFWFDSLKKLCDSDNSSEGKKNISNDIVRPVNEVARRKLRFTEDDEDCCSGDTERNSSEDRRRNNSDKENISDFSDIEDFEPLLERIKKKLGIPLGIKSDDSKQNKDKNVRAETDVSEKKRQRPKKKQTFSTIIDTAPLKMNVTNTVNTSTTKSFLASLSKSVQQSEADALAVIFRNSFKQFRSELTKKLFNLYNERVFDNGIPEDSQIDWSERMRGTAGFCYCKKRVKSDGSVERKVNIVLASKVLDSADRLRDTLIHEMCHAATWIIDGMSDAHGSYWRAWVERARKTFPELPPIKVCHNYTINTKYTYKCVDCDYSFGRHTKSLDIEKKRCGYCYGKFEVFINKILKNGETKKVPATPKKQPTGFALFVKENYALYKTPQLNHGQVMKLLGEKFNELKVSVCVD